MQLMAWLVEVWKNAIQAAEALYQLIRIGGGNQVVKKVHAFAPTDRELLETRFATIKLQPGVI